MLCLLRTLGGPADELLCPALTRVAQGVMVGHRMHACMLAAVAVPRPPPPSKKVAVVAWRHSSAAELQPLATPSPNHHTDAACTHPAACWPPRLIDPSKCRKPVQGAAAAEHLHGSTFTAAARGSEAPHKGKRMLPPAALPGEQQGVLTAALTPRQQDPLPPTVSLEAPPRGRAPVRDPHHWGAKPWHADARACLADQPLSHQEESRWVW